MTQYQALLQSEGAATPPLGRPVPAPGRRSAALAAALIAGWCATGITAVGVGHRAIYERLGAPVAVLHPGLHLGLPWPFGRMRPIDFGAVRAIALPCCPGVQVLYRVGLTDAQAMDAAYASADPGALVQAKGSAIAARAGGAGSLRPALQAALDGIGSGLEVIGVVGAPEAEAPDDTLRAAEIGAETLLGEARDAVAIERLEARQTAAALIAGARAKAAETVASARSQLVQFTADRAANAADSKSFLLERYFANLSRAIATAPKTIIDHRLNWPAAPELDLRPPPGVADAAKGN